MRSRIACTTTLVAASTLLAGCGTNTPAPTNGASSSVASAVSSTTGGSSSGGQCPPAEGAATRTTSFTQAPPMCIDPNKTYTANVTTDAGSFTIQLDAKKAPKTVNNFVFLARHKFYDGIVFHRVLKGFMAQTGDPEGTGQGGPGYEFADELPKAGEYKIGSVAMANTMQPNTNGSQFFIVTGQGAASLKPDYSLFGQVTSGMETIKKIEADGSDADPAPPAKVHKITKVQIDEK